MMKRVLASALLLGAVSALGLVGCSDKAKVEESTTIQTPTGTTTDTTTREVKTTEPGGAPGTPTSK